MSDMRSYECYELLCVQLAVMITVTCYACDIKVQFSLFRLFEVDSEHAGPCLLHVHMCSLFRACGALFAARAHVVFVPSMRCLVLFACVTGERFSKLEAENLSFCLFRSS